MNDREVSLLHKACMLLAIIGLMPITAFADTSGNVSGNSFRQAKKQLVHVYSDHRTSFYAGCAYGKKGHVKASSCGYKARKNKKRGKKIEWEHVVPAWAFGHALQCWQNTVCTTSKGKAYKGRKCCGRSNDTFRAMESDMHNLVPAIGELNGDRSNFRYGMISGESRRYGDVDFEVDFKHRVAEPAMNVRGDIARTYFYMEKVYGLNISKKQRRLFDVWNREDPVDAWEVWRNKKIMALQGNSNPFVARFAASVKTVKRTE
ncbi:endonuclease [Mariprofundus sp. EBB-1]|uniref:endonuclease n=1 Tax=Mariprofundus sp. EBB-1 TaxID=2650971 RepID=UPI0019137723|nr:endonuclease [Mariprofundus sp. EBB-1]